MKGLESLIPDKKDELKGVKKKESVFLIDVEQIKENPYQPRREFNKEQLEELADSIKVYGILQPLIATKIEHDVPSGRMVEYELITGERRLRAAKIAGLPRVPVIVRRSSDKEKLEISLIENIQRDDLSPVEEARAYKRLQDEFGVKQKKIAQYIFKSPSYVANTMRILSLPDTMQSALGQGEITEGHTRPLLSLQETSNQEKLFQEILNQNLNVRQAEARAREFKSPKTKMVFGQGRSTIDPELIELVEEFKNTFNISDARVKINGRKAYLAVHFSSKRHLRKWIKNLLS